MKLPSPLSCKGFAFGMAPIATMAASVNCCFDLCCAEHAQASRQQFPTNNYIPHCRPAAKQAQARSRCLPLRTPSNQPTRTLRTPLTPSPTSPPSDLRNFTCARTLAKRISIRVRCTPTIRRLCDLSRRFPGVQGGASRHGLRPPSSVTSRRRSRT